MASSTLKTQFSPYIAQLGMPSKWMLSAFGDAVDEYELDKRKDILFGIQEKQGNLSNEKTAFDLEQAKIRAPFENESKELDVQNKRFEVNELNPLKKTTEQNRADKTGIELQNEQYMFYNGANEIKLDTLKNQQKVANVNAKYAEQEKELEIGAKSNTQKLAKLKLEDASSDDIIKKTASFFYTDSNGDGIIDEKDFAAVQKELKNNPNIPTEKLNEAYMYAKERVLKLNELDSKAQKNLGITHKQGGTSDKFSSKMASGDMMINTIMDAIDYYDPANTGIFDNAVDTLASKTVNWGDSEGRTAYRQHIGRLSSMERNELFGSAVTKAENETAQSFLPSLNDSESVAKQKLLGFLKYQSDFINKRYFDLDPTKKEAYKETYLALRSDLDDAMKNAESRFGSKRVKTTMPTEGNTTKGTPKFSTKKEGNTTTPIDINNNKYF